jgi:hypothetical protein
LSRRRVDPYIFSAFDFRNQPAAVQGDGGNQFAV